MVDFIPNDEFAKTEYGRLNKILDGKKYFGKLAKTKLPENSTIVADPKDGNFGVIKDSQGNQIGKVDLVD